jgi:hypothetical protein
MHRRLFLIAVVSAGLPPAFAAPSARAEEEGGRKKGGGETYIQIRTLTANTTRADGRRGVFTAEAGVDVPDPGLHARALSLMPALRDAYASSVMVFAGALRPGQVPDLDLLEARLQADTNRILGRPGARLLLGTCLVN